jgi:hypothetical protein
MQRLKEARSYQPRQAVSTNGLAEGQKRAAWISQLLSANLC